MRKAKFLFGLSAVLVALLFSGCEKDSETTEAYPDAYISSVMSESGPVYAVVQIVYSYSKIESVNVTLPSGAAGSLENYQNGGYSFFDEPETSEYTAFNSSMLGTYTYDVKFGSGETKSYANAVTKYLSPAQNVTVTETTSGIKLAWDKVDGVEAYQLTVTKGETVIDQSSLFTVAESIDRPEVTYSITSNFTSNMPGTFEFKVTALDFENTDNTKYESVSNSVKTFYLD